MNKGVVSWFCPARGYGFIDDAEGGIVFVNQRNINMSGFRQLIRGQEVEYQIEQNEKGRNALNVKVIE